jgi:hypothetical protein
MSDTYIFTGLVNGSVLVFDRDNHKLLYTLSGHKGRITDIDGEDTFFQITVYVG